MNQLKTINMEANSLSKAAGEIWDAEFNEKVDDIKKIRSTFSYEK